MVTNFINKLKTKLGGDNLVLINNAKRLLPYGNAFIVTLKTKFTTKDVLVKYLKQYNDEPVYFKGAKADGMDEKLLKQLLLLMIEDLRRYGIVLAVSGDDIIVLDR